MPDLFTDMPTIKVEDADIETEWYSQLRVVRAEQSVHLPNSVEIRFRDHDFAIFDSGRFELGAALQISFTNGSITKTIVTADITAQSVEPSFDGRHDLVVTGLDRGHRLTLGARVQSYVGLRDSEVAAEIAERHGLTCESEATAQVHDYLFQDDTDYQFLSDRARAIGYEWWVNDRTLHFKPLAEEESATSLEWGQDLYSFRVRLSAATAATESTAQGWNPTTQEPLVGTATVPTSAAALGSGAPAATKAADAARALDGKYFEGLVDAFDETEADTRAKAIATRAADAMVVAKGETIGNPSLAAGQWIHVIGMGDKLSGTYLLTSVVHHVAAGTTYTTGFVAGTRQPDRLPDLLGSRRRCRGQELASKLVNGLVTSIEDPDGRGRVELKFPALNESATTTWARVASPGAGKSRGMQLDPEVGDEVLVGFESGDRRRPVVLGGLWSARNTPPLVGEETIKEKAVVSRSWVSRLGHKIELADGQEEEDKAINLTLADEKTNVHLGQDAVSANTPMTLSITTGKDITITANESGNATITANEITLNARKKLTLSAPEVSIKGSTSVSMSGGSISASAESELSMRADGETSVQGSIVKLN